LSRQYIIRRLLIMLPSLFGISIVLFTVLALAPGDPFEELATNPAIPPEVRAALRAKFGLDDPVWTRYLHWLSAEDGRFVARYPTFRTVFFAGEGVLNGPISVYVNDKTARPEELAKPVHDGDILTLAVSGGCCE